MQPVLTTITPYWGRPEMLGPFLKALAAAHVPQVRHLLYFVGEYRDLTEYAPNNGSLTAVELSPWGYKSIGHIHNLGATQAETEWIMKLDVDCLVHPDFFKSLLPVLASAYPKEWFNIGMFYLTPDITRIARKDFSMKFRDYLLSTLSVWSKLNGPAGSNFVCRKEDYIASGWCHPGFVGYGWEDYYQMFFLERRQLGRNPLPGGVNASNVTQRCRDEIGRPKAQESFNRNWDLVLFHQWHAPNTNPRYRTTKQMNDNRRILLDSILLCQ